MRLLPFALAGLLALVSEARRKLEDTKKHPDFQTFATEPKSTAMRIEIFKNDNASELAPGYVFLTPYQGPKGWGPHIYDNDGNLVWDGHETVKYRAMDAKPCLVDGKYDHICYNDARPVQQGGHSRGVVRFFDNSYQQVGTDYEGVNGLIGPDIHELNTPIAGRGKTFIQDIYETRKMDLSTWEGPEDGRILDGCFQEVDIKTHKVDFQWCALDHVDIDETYVYLPFGDNYTIPGLAGNGREGAPWDWFHINAIDRNTQGDYLISARHLSTIFHIAGKNNAQGLAPGEIIWRLGGKLSNFTFEDNLNFSAQHTIRYIDVESSDKDDKWDVVLFDNASDGRTETAEHSSGIILTLDLKKMHASLKHRYIQPKGKIAQDQGNAQVLPNGNVFIGWGHCNYFSEHAEDGEVLYHGRYGGPGDCDPEDDRFFVTNFRAWRAPWVGKPKTKPKVLAYAYGCDTDMTAYASWNGATDVAKWSFYISNSTDPDSFEHVATVPKKGFETSVELPGSALYVYAVALDAHATDLATSQTVMKFVPRDDLNCTTKGCPEPALYYVDGNSRTLDDCVPGGSSTTPHKEPQAKPPKRPEQRPSTAKTQDDSGSKSGIIQPDTIISAERWDCMGLSALGCVATIMRDWVVESFTSG